MLSNNLHLLSQLKFAENGFALCDYLYSHLLIKVLSFPQNLWLFIQRIKIEYFPN